MGNTELTEAGTPSPEANTGTDFDLVIRGERIVTGAGTVAREIGVRDGKVVAIERLGNNLAGATVIEL
jgi:allantoinase